MLLVAPCDFCAPPAKAPLPADAEACEEVAPCVEAGEKVLPGAEARAVAGRRRQHSRRQAVPRGNVLTVLQTTPIDRAAASIVSCVKDGGQPVLVAVGHAAVNVAVKAVAVAEIIFSRNDPQQERTTSLAFTPAFEQVPGKPPGYKRLALTVKPLRRPGGSVDEWTTIRPPSSDERLALAATSLKKCIDQQGVGVVAAMGSLATNRAVKSVVLAGHFMRNELKPGAEPVTVVAFPEFETFKEAGVERRRLVLDCAKYWPAGSS